MNPPKSATSFVYRSFVPMTRVGMPAHSSEDRRCSRLMESKALLRSRLSVILPKKVLGTRPAGELLACAHLCFPDVPKGGQGNEMQIRQTVFDDYLGICKVSIPYRSLRAFCTPRIPNSRSRNPHERPQAPRPRPHAKPVSSTIDPERDTRKRLSITYKSPKSHRKNPEP